MIEIKKATVKDAALLAKISVASFIPAHGHSAPKNVIDSYILKNFSEESFMKELSNKKLEYYLLLYKGEVAGYSKIILNTGNENLKEKNVTKMERLYLLKEFYNLGLGKALLDFNIALAKENNQAGIFLFVWIENLKAFTFYKKRGFVKIGDYDFVLSPEKVNPNHVLYLEF